MLVGVTVRKAAVNISDRLKTVFGPMERMRCSASFLFVLDFLFLLPLPSPSRAHAASTNLTHIPWRRWLYPAGQAGIRSPTQPSGRSCVGAVRSGPAVRCSHRPMLVATDGCVSAGKETLVSPQWVSSQRTGLSCSGASFNPPIVCTFKLCCDVIGLIITIMSLCTSKDCNLTYGNKRQLD